MEHCRAGALTGLARTPCTRVCRAYCTPDICFACSIQGYKQVCGFADVWGDGIIPLESAHLDGAQGDLFWLKYRYGVLHVLMTCLYEHHNELINMTLLLVTCSTP